MTEKEIEIRERLEKIWNTLEPSIIDNSEMDFNKIAPKLLGFLITSLIHQKEIDIGNSYENSKVSSIVSYNIYNSDKQLNLKLHTSNIFELEFLYNEFEEDERKYNYELNHIDERIIPEGLINIMKEVYYTQKPMSVSGNSLSI